MRTKFILPHDNHSCLHSWHWLSTASLSVQCGAARTFTRRSYPFIDTPECHLVDNALKSLSPVYSRWSLLKGLVNKTGPELHGLRYQWANLAPPMGVRLELRQELVAGCSGHVLSVGRPAATMLCGSPLRLYFMSTDDQSQGPISSIPHCVRVIDWQAIKGFHHKEFFNFHPCHPAK